MYDETYVLGHFSELLGQEFYVADSRGNVDEQFRTRKQSKFPKRFLVWQAICSSGKRNKFFVGQGIVNSNIYIKECMQKRFLPFLREHNESTFFWPDLASCHYSRATAEWYNANGVVFVPKEANPPNCPELRPVERYWALVKRDLKETKGATKSLQDFRRKWKRASEKVAESSIKSMMEEVPEKINKFCQK